MNIVGYDGSRCTHCGSSQVILKRCGGCKLVYYCGVTCQTQHWHSKHKYECKGMRTDGTLANILEIGTIPKTILTDKLTLSEDETNDSNAIREVTDFHVWCVDERNNIYDYPIEQIKSIHWTNRIIRRPFDIEHAMSKYQFMIKFRKRLISYKTDIEPLNQEQKMAMIESDLGCKFRFRFRLLLTPSIPLRQNPTEFRRNSEKIRSFFMSHLRSI